MRKSINLSTNPWFEGCRKKERKKSFKKFHWIEDISICIGFRSEMQSASNNLRVILIQICSICFHFWNIPGWRKFFLHTYFAIIMFECWKNCKQIDRSSLTIEVLKNSMPLMPHKANSHFKCWSKNNFKTFYCSASSYYGTI